MFIAMGCGLLVERERKKGGREGAREEGSRQMQSTVVQAYNPSYLEG